MLPGSALLGHLTEMAEGSGLTAEIYYDRIPIIDGAKEYIVKKVIPGATNRNWNSLGNKVMIDQNVPFDEAKNLLADPQTNGGLLVSVSRESVGEVEKVFVENGYDAFIQPIGQMLAESDKVIRVILSAVKNV